MLRLFRARKKMRIMEKKRPKYSGWRKRVMVTYAVILVLCLAISIERTVIDVLGEMWSTMLLNSTATMCSIAGLLGICAGEKIVFALYAVWSVLALLLNLAIVFIYNELGLLTETEKYLGGGDNYWQAHGLLCTDTQEQDGSIDGSGTFFLSGDGERDMNSCLVYYSIVETIHASVFMLLVVISFVQSMLLLCSRETQPKYSIYEESDDDDFSYVNLAHEYQWRENQSSRRNALIYL